MLRDVEAEDKFGDVLTSLLADEAKMDDLRNQIGKLAVHDSDVKIAKEIMEIINVGK